MDTRHCERCEKETLRKRRRCAGCERLCCGRCGLHGPRSRFECWDCQRARETRGTRAKKNAR